MLVQEVQKTEKKVFRRPLLFKSKAKLEKKIEKFFKDCKKKKKVATITGLAVALDTSRETLLNYEKREEFFDTIQRAKQIIEAETEQKLFSAYTNGAKFSLTNNFKRWSERVEIGGDDKVNKDNEIKSLVQNIFIMIQGKNKAELLEGEAEVRNVIDNIGQGEIIDLKAISDGK